MLGAVKNASSKAGAPALAVGAAAAGVAGGIALKSRRRRKHVLGVPLPRSVAKPSLPGTKSLAKTVGDQAKRLGKT